MKFQSLKVKLRLPPSAEDYKSLGDDDHDCAENRKELSQEASWPPGNKED
jgi:hypothetical protein